MGRVDTRLTIRAKLDAVLQHDNFYAFKIFKGNDVRTEIERAEITRLISDCKQHGRKIVENFDQARPLPTNFNEEEAKDLDNRVGMLKHLAEKCFQNGFEDYNRECMQTGRCKEIEA